MKPLVYKKTRGQRRRKPAPQPMKLPMTKGDTVQIISGEAKGRRGTVLRVLPRKGRIVVEGVNVVKRHRSATANAEAGIIEFPAPIHHSKAMLIDPKTGEPTRVRRRKDADGTVERIAVKSGQPVPRSR